MHIGSYFLPVSASCLQGTTHQEILTPQKLQNTAELAASRCNKHAHVHTHRKKFKLNFKVLLKKKKILKIYPEAYHVKKKKKKKNKVKSRTELGKKC